MLEAAAEPVAHGALLRARQSRHRRGGRPGAGAGRGGAPPGRPRLRPRHRPHRGRPGAAALARPRRRARGARPRRLRPHEGGGRDRVEQGLREAAHGAPRHPDGPVRRSRTRATRRREPRARAGAAGGAQGRRPRGRQGRAHPARRCRARGRARHVLRRAALRHQRRPRRGGALPLGRGALLHGALGRHPRPAARPLPRLQAAGRRGRRPQHRRHGGAQPAGGAGQGPRGERSSSG